MRMLHRACTAAARKSMTAAGNAPSDEVFKLEGLGAEPPDGHRRPVERERRDDGVDAAAVAEASVDHRAGLVDAPADAPDDAVDDLPQVRIVAEADVDRLEAAAALDVDAVEAVDQDVADR